MPHVVSVGEQVFFRNRGCFQVFTKPPIQLVKKQSSTNMPKRSRLDYFLLQLALFFPTTVAGDNWLNWIHLGPLLDETVCSRLQRLCLARSPGRYTATQSVLEKAGFQHIKLLINLQLCQIWKIQGSTVPYQNIVSRGEIFRIFY